MLFPGKLYQIIQYDQKITRKDIRQLPARLRIKCFSERAFSDMSASMTLEAACVLPWFLFAMLAVMQFFKIITVSVVVLAGMQNAAKDMAAYAYIQQLGVTAGDGIAADLITGGLSVAYAKGKIENETSFSGNDGTLHFWKSSFLNEDIIDLSVTYNPKNTYTLLPIPQVKSALRARVRAWTGRDGNGFSDEDVQSGEDEEMVLVTETGSVYHTDENCTHLKLSIRRVQKSDLSKLRNQSGGRYHACERCGGGGSLVYITDTGDRYHSSVNCSGLKRTIRKVPISEVENKRKCSKCAGA